MSHNNLHRWQHSKWLTSKCSDESDLNGCQPFPRPVYSVLSTGLMHASQSGQLRGSGMANYGSIGNFVCLCVMLELPCSLGEYNRHVQATSSVRLRVYFPVRSTF